MQRFFRRQISLTFDSRAPTCKTGAAPSPAFLRNFLIITPTPQFTARRHQMQNREVPRATDRTPLGKPPPPVPHLGQMGPGTRAGPGDPARGRLGMGFGGGAIDRGAGCYRETIESRTIRQRNWLHRANPVGQ